ncbi:hypothetical protein ACFLXO_03250 [Chloroflexota bacterium]
MSDFVQGALTGGALALVGSVIVALIAHYNTKLQIKGSLDQLSLKLEQDTGEKYRDRLVEARKTYLIPLRDIISRWSVELTKLPGLATALNRLALSSADISSVTESQIYKDSIEFNRRMTSMAQQHEVFLGQISDKKLLNMIIKATETQGEAIVRRTEIHESVVIDKDFKSLGNAINESNKILLNVQLKLIDINKRIEELLCGNDSE